MLILKDMKNIIREGPVWRKKMKMFLSAISLLCLLNPWSRPMENVCRRAEKVMGLAYFDIIYLLISLLPDLSPSDSLRSQMFLKNTIEMLTISTTKASSYLSRTKEKPVELGLKLTPDSYSAMHNTTFYIYALKSSYRMIVLKIIHYIATKNMKYAITAVIYA